MNNLTFKGGWPDDNPKGSNWETFHVYLWGEECGDMVRDPKEVEETLARAGLTLVRSGS